MWIGRRLNGGALLYRDILEVNPPLWFWLGAGVEWVAARTGIGGPQVLALLFGLQALKGWALIVQMVHSREERVAAGCALVATLLLTSPYAHLQREQYLFIAVLPYVLLIGQRAAGRTVAAWVAVAAALLAAPGLALKHHFLLLPLMLEGWLWWRQGRPSIRPEHLALLVAGGAYAAAVMLLTPAYLDFMVPLLRLAYHGYNPPALSMLAQPALVAALLALVAAGLRRKALSRLSEASAVATIAFVLAFLWQGKNFHYQAIPALGFALLALLLMLLDSAQRNVGEGTEAMAAALLACIAVPLLAGGARSDRPFAATAGDGDVRLISVSSALGWPTIYERALPWRSRFMSDWLLIAPALAEADGRDEPALADLGHRIRRELAAEIGCARPARLLVDTRVDDRMPGGSMLDWLAREPRFAATMAGYVEVSRKGFLRVFHRRPGTVPACVAGDRRAVGG